MFRSPLLLFPLTAFAFASELVAASLEINAAKKQFIYALERNGQPRYKAVFSLKTGMP